MRNPSRLAPLQGVSQALHLLSHIASNPPATPTELSRATGINRTTVYRLIETMTQVEFLVWTEDNRVAMGPAVWAFLHAVQSQNTVVSLAMPVLFELWQETRESVSLSLRHGNDVVRVAGFESPEPLRVAIQLGDRWPLHVTARARVVLAALPDEERERYLRKGLARFASGTITDPDVLRRDCELIRLRGYAISRSEFVEDAGCIASPIYWQGVPTGSIDVAGPLPRILQVPPEMVVRAASTISKTEMSRSR